MDYKSKYFKYREKNILLEQQLGGGLFSSSLDSNSLSPTIKQLILDVKKPQSGADYAPFCATAEIAPDNYKYSAFLNITNGRLLCKTINELMKNDCHVWRICYRSGAAKYKNNNNLNCDTNRSSADGTNGGLGGNFKSYIKDIQKIKCKANYDTDKNSSGIEAEIQKLEFGVERISLSPPSGQFFVKLHISGNIPAMIGFGRTKTETWIIDLKLVGIGGNSERTSCGNEQIVIDTSQFREFRLDKKGNPAVYKLELKDITGDSTGLPKMCKFV